MSFRLPRFFYVDNTPTNTGSGGDTIATDELVTINGAAVTGVVKAQRVKVGFGSDGIFRDVDSANPLPTTTPNASVTGTFTATDAVVAAPIGDGTIVSGASTAGSIIALALPSNMSAWLIMLKVYTTGTVYSEASPNSTNGTDGDWVEIKGRKTGTAPGIESVGYAFTSSGMYRGNAATFIYFRLRYVGTFTAGMTALISLSHATGAVFLNSGIPGGNSVLGKMGIDQTTPGSTNLVASNEAAAIVSPVTILQNAATATGVGTSITVTGYGTVVLKIIGTFVATTFFEFSTDAGTTWDLIAATQIGAGDIFTSTTLQGSFRITCTGLDLIRARVVLTSGTININGRATNAINAGKVVKLASGTNIFGKAGIDQTTDGTTNAVRLLAETTKVIGTVLGVFFQATQPVSLAVNTPDVIDRAARLLGITTIANLDVALSTRLKAADTLAAVTLISDIRQSVAANLQMTATPIAITKGTQGATGFTTQDLKDAGRVMVSISATQVAGVTAEALISLTPYRDLVAGTAATTFAITAGKRLRIQSMTVTWRNTTAAAGGVTVRLRFLAGAVLVTSPVYASLNASTGLATIGSGTSSFEDFPDGLELSGTMQLGITQIAVGAVSGFDINLIGYEY